MIAPGSLLKHRHKRGVFEYIDTAPDGSLKCYGGRRIWDERRDCWRWVKAAFYNFRPELVREIDQ